MDSASSSGDVVVVGRCKLVVVGATGDLSLVLNCPPVLEAGAAELMHHIGRSSANAVEIGMPCCGEDWCALRVLEMQWCMPRCGCQSPCRARLTLVMGCTMEAEWDDEKWLFHKYS